MVIIIIFALISGLLFMLDEGIFGFFMGAFMGALLGFIVALFVGLALYTGTEQDTHTAKLESLVDGGDIRGSFFLGSGVINNVNVFTWYEQSESNSYVQRQADADTSTVHFVAPGEKPYYVVLIKHYKSGPFLGTWGLNLGGGELSRKYDFYVPKGTIKNNYELDAE